MLEMTASEVFRFVLFAMLISAGLAVFIFVFNSMYLSQQLQSASDLLSATGGYMRTEEQQRKWWSMTHNPMFRLTDVHFVGLTAADKKSGITTNRIDRGVPNGKTTSYTGYREPDSSGTNGHASGTISGTSFDDIENQATSNKFSGGLALNGPTGVRVNPKALTDKLIGRRGYMMVPAHYGTSIVFTIHSKIPVPFMKQSELSVQSKNSYHDFVAQTTSLRGSDQLYVDSGDEQSTDHEADAEARGLNMLKLAAGTVSDSNSFGYGQIGLDLNDQSKTAYQSQANAVLTQYSSRLRNAKSVGDVVNITREGLAKFAGILANTKATDSKTGKQVPLTNTNNQPATLQFKGATGRQFTANQMPDDYTQWPKVD